MKVIFLDHDGVICLLNQWGSRGAKRAQYDAENPKKMSERRVYPVDISFDDFDQSSVNILNQILDETGAEIVVSSDWKKYCTLDEMKELYQLRGIKKVPIDFTPSTSTWPSYRLDSTRVNEINNWLALHPEVEKWVAVDDLPLNLCGIQNFVHITNEIEGLAEIGKAEKIKEFLK